MESVRCADCQFLQRRIHDLQAENEQLCRQLDAAMRAGQRQAGRFANGQPKSNPRKPGRKPGKDHGTKANRQPPSPKQMDEVHEASLPDPCKRPPPSAPLPPNWDPMPSLPSAN